MKRLGIAVFVLVALGLALFWFLTAPVAAVVAGVHPALEDGDAARGEIVFNAGGCASCHMKPDQPDHLNLGGGLALKTGFGTFVAPNISSHPRDGIGAWTTADLANAMLHGVSPQGTHYYPAFPYTTYAHVKVQDVSDLRAYLRILPSVEGQAPAHDLAFPFNFRRGIGLWKWLYLDTTPIRDDPARSAEWNRGRYLVEALGHCAECHSPRDSFGGIVTAQRYAGGPDPEGTDFLPNISGKTLGSWSKEEVAELLATGMTPDDKVSGSMAAVVKNMARLPQSDRDAMAEYLKSLPVLQTPPRPKKG